MRFPTINVSLVDLSLIANEAPLVSVDFNHNPASCIFDATQTRVTGRMVKVLAATLIEYAAD